MATPRTVGLPALPPVAAGLADALVLVLHVADLSDGRPALLVDLARLAGGSRTSAQPPLAPSAARPRRPSGPSGRPCRACSSMLWIVVPSGIDLHRERVAHDDVGLGRGDDLGADREAGRRQDVTPLAVGVADERDVRACGSGRTRWSRPFRGRRACPAGSRSPRYRRL